MEIGQSAAKSYAYLLGVYLGDGHVSSASYAQCTIDEDFAHAVRAALENLGAKVTLGYNPIPKGNPKNSPQWTIWTSNNRIRERLVTDTQRKQVIPEFVHSWPIELRKEFVIGLMDSEGFVAANHVHRGYDWKPTNRSFYMGYKSCDVWVPDLIKIMESIGLHLGKVSNELPLKPWHKVPTRFHIKMQSWVDAGLRFNIARKQNRVDEWASVGPYERRALHPRGGPQRLCTMLGCKSKYLAKGFCNRHYKQAQTKLRDHTQDASQLGGDDMGRPQTERLREVEKFTSAA